MTMKRVSEAYPPRFAPAENYPLGQWMRRRIRDVVQEEFPYGTRYGLISDDLDGRPWADGLAAILPEGQAKVLGFAFGDAPEGWRGHVVDLSPQPYNYKGQTGVTWHVMPVHQQPAVPPVPPSAREIVAPAANTRPRQAPSPAVKADDLDTILNDEIPTFDPPEAPVAAPAAQEKGRRPGRPRKEMR